jgi:hypothetical protein
MGGRRREKGARRLEDIERAGEKEKQPAGTHDTHTWNNK